VRVAAGRYADAYLQRADIQRGYTVVVWHGRHVAEPTELTDAEAAGYWLEVLRVARALLAHYRPLKLNYETLGNAVPHLHTHLIPRYTSDPAPGRPFPLPAFDGTEPTLPDELVERDAQALRLVLGELP
jgi:diadenosine tetraphosphate (Ap4A) HIT family hydrolase